MTNSARLLIGQFCDDIRQEVGNKLTLVGCYAEDLIVARLPVTLPQLAVQLRAVTPIDTPFERLTLRTYLSSTVLGELVVPSNALRITAERGPEHRWAWISSIMVMAPLHLPQECELRTEAETEAGILKGSTLRVRLANVTIEQRSSLRRKKPSLKK